MEIKDLTIVQMSIWDIKMKKIWNLSSRINYSRHQRSMKLSVTSRPVKAS